jgi:hypothetical protein
MGKVLELSEETYQHLADLAKQQQRSLEEMLRLCLATYEAALYEHVHRQMVAEGLLAAMPMLPLAPDVENFEPEAIPGPPLSETILEERSRPARVGRPVHATVTTTRTRPKQFIAGKGHVPPTFPHIALPATDVLETP